MADELGTVRGLYAEATRLRDYADAVELAAEGDRAGLDPVLGILGLYNTAHRIQELLGVLAAINGAQRTVIPFPTERTPS